MTGRRRQSPSYRAPSDGSKTVMRCAVYTRVSSDGGLDQDFNSLQAQREACEAYSVSQAREGWRSSARSVRRRWLLGWQHGATRLAASAR